MDSQMVEQGTSVGRIRGDHHQPIVAHPRHHGQAAGGLQDGGLDLTQSGGLAQGRGLANEGRSKGGRGIRIHRSPAGGMNRQAIGARQYHCGDVGTVAERPYDLSQSGQATSSADATENGERNVGVDESEVKQ